MMYSKTPSRRPLSCNLQSSALSYSPCFSWSQEATPKNPRCMALLIRTSLCSRPKGSWAASTPMSSCWASSGERRPRASGTSPPGVAAPSAPVNPCTGNGAPDAKRCSATSMSLSADKSRPARGTARATNQRSSLSVPAGSCRPSSSTTRRQASTAASMALKRLLRVSGSLSAPRRHGLPLARVSGPLRTWLADGDVYRDASAPKRPWGESRSSRRKTGGAVRPSAPLLKMTCRSSPMAPGPGCTMPGPSLGSRGKARSSKQR
mmetsp:Transcript_1080/g.2925  ORF Transcript_1080/g.2925 Transcript_1080/m.2925 type:complete len:263 (-) Transcript_1080:2196-2984(-)